MNIVDSRRVKNPNVRDYMFFSSQHKTYSRIDYILISAAFMSSALVTEILPMLISDHCPVKITISKSHLFIN